MPNWCSNVVQFTHIDPEQITQLVEAWNSGEGFFNKYVTRPASEEENWYDWNVTHWGTKWDVSSEEWSRIENLEENAATVTIGFDTAWAPPIAFYAAMADKGFIVSASYYEPGMAFCGQWDSEFGEQHYDITGNAAWVKENIPEDIDEMFSIAESMEMWEND